MWHAGRLLIIGGLVEGELAARGGGWGFLLLHQKCTENFMKAFLITIKLLYASVQRALMHMRCLFTEFR